MCFGIINVLKNSLQMTLFFFQLSMTSFKHLYLASEKALDLTNHTTRTNSSKVILTLVAVDSQVRVELFKQTKKKIDLMEGGNAYPPCRSL